MQEETNDAPIFPRILPNGNREKNVNEQQIHDETNETRNLQRILLNRNSEKYKKATNETNARRTNDVRILHQWSARIANPMQISQKGKKQTGETKIQNKSIV